jgi:hypothetical protein
MSYNESIQPEGLASNEMPTDKLSEDHKSKLDKLMEKSSHEHLQHMKNHISNAQDKLRDHALNAVTMKDFEKVMSRNKDTDQDGDTKVDTDKDNA